MVERVGWCVREAGRRAWLVRIRDGKSGEGNGGKGETEGGEEVKGDKVDDGSRSWKWGACYWGMRKVPVARAEVGGMYGHYMFKR